MAVSGLYVHRSFYFGSTQSTAAASVGFMGSTLVCHLRARTPRPIRSRVELGNSEYTPDLVRVF